MKCLIYFTYLNGNRLYYLVNNLFNFSSKLNNAGAKNSFRWWFIPMIESKSDKVDVIWFDSVWIIVLHRVRVIVVTLESSLRNMPHEPNANTNWFLVFTLPHMGIANTNWFLVLTLPIELCEFLHGYFASIIILKLWNYNFREFRQVSIAQNIKLYLTSYTILFFAKVGFAIGVSDYFGSFHDFCCLGLSLWTVEFSSYFILSIFVFSEFSTEKTLVFRKEKNESIMFQMLIDISVSSLAISWSFEFFPWSKISRLIEWS